jgi:hypothetical protein
MLVAQPLTKFIVVAPHVFAKSVATGSFILRKIAARAAEGRHRCGWSILLRWRPRAGRQCSKYEKQREDVRDRDPGITRLACLPTPHENKPEYITASQKASATEGGIRAV